MGLDLDWGLKNSDAEPMGKDRMIEEEETMDGTPSLGLLDRGFRDCN